VAGKQEQKGDCPKVFSKATWNGVILCCLGAGEDSSLPMHNGE